GTPGEDRGGGPVTRHAQGFHAREYCGPVIYSSGGSGGRTRGALPPFAGGLPLAESPMPSPAPTEPVALGYAQRTPTWGPVAFRPSIVTLLLLILGIPAWVYLQHRHAPWELSRAIVVEPGDWHPQPSIFFKTPYPTIQLM